jgi:hypothetical protein
VLPSPELQVAQEAASGSAKQHEAPHFETHEKKRNRSASIASMRTFNIILLDRALA